MLKLENIFPLGKILIELQKTDEFLLWVKKKYDNLNEDELFEGYKFFTRLVLSGILDIINDEDFLPLEKDEIYNRSKHLFDSYKEYPNTCEKVIFLKNLIQIIRVINSAKDFTEYKNRLTNLNNLVDMLELLLDKQTKSKYSSIVKSTIIRYDVLSFINYAFNDTNDSYPHIQRSLFLMKSYITQDYSKIILKGFVYTLQYIWYVFLNEKYNSSPITKLHESLLVEYYKPKECHSYKKETSSVWWEINKYHRAMNKYLFTLMNNNFSSRYWELDSLLVFSHSGDNKDKIVRKLDVYLDEDIIKDVDYLVNDDLDSKIKRLDMQMHFYPAESISYLYQSVFSGADAFKIILKALVLQKKESKDERKISTKIFKHPVYSEDRRLGNMISLAILVPHSWKEKDNGWLIFSHCTTDFSGYGSQLYEESKKLINENLSFIDFEEIHVTNQVFGGYLRYRSATIGSYSTIHELVEKEELDTYIETTETQIKDIRNKYIGSIEEAKSKLFEKVVYEWYTEELKDENVDIKSNYKISIEEIDVILFYKDEIHVIECKLDVHDKHEKIIRQLDRRYIEAKSNHPNYMVEKILVVYNTINMERKTDFIDNGIIVKDNFRETIEESHLGEKRTLFTILDDKSLFDLKK